MGHRVGQHFFVVKCQTGPRVPSPSLRIEAKLVEPRQALLGWVGCVGENQRPQTLDFPHVQYGYSYGVGFLVLSLRDLAPPSSGMPEARETMDFYGRSLNPVTCRIGSTEEPATGVPRSSSVTRLCLFLAVHAGGHPTLEIEWTTCKMMGMHLAKTLSESCP